MKAAVHFWLGKAAATALLLSLLVSFSARAAAEESLGTKVKRVFDPTPTPTPPKHRKSASPSPAKNKKASPSPSSSPTVTPKKEEESAAEPSEKPTPARKGKGKGKKNGSPSPTASPSASESATPPPTPTETPTPSATPAPRHDGGAPNASVAPGQIAGFDDYPPELKKILEGAIELTTRNLTYKYGSADPAQGGMDCSGFVYFVLSKSGVHDVPRDSSSQYVWLRKAGKFRPVVSHKDDSFELDELRPGDLLFWTGTYKIDRDPPITHAMIYLGREKGTNDRIMVGASDGRSYKGQSRNGVSVFDFRISRSGTPSESRPNPTFVGYAHIPGVNDR